MDSGNNKKNNTPQDEPQSTLDWLYNTAVSFLPSWSATTASGQATTQQPSSGTCQKTSAPVCHCNKNRPK